MATTASVSADNSPLHLRILIEASAATISAFTVAPAISIVDKAIVSNASGLEPLVPSLINGCKSLVTNPIYFLKQPSFLFIWGVYSGTYIVANSIEAICQRSGQDSFYPKFFGSSMANVSLSVMKDKAFARMFGTGAPKPMSYSSMGCFATRDSMTILASFSLPGIISKKMQNNGTSAATSDMLAQLFTPVSMQILSTPLHLYGLDMYNRSVATAAQRQEFVKTEYLKTTLARMARIFPAFGIGGVVNKYVRKEGNAKLQTMYH
ncbi:hypothetical protein B484DRAFT_446311 [Ochromonadaceae sp. CCMP2298]|nr:hypothetical protein B484DRAFT_446311 [Ochromonadaceae sp. CCMP2298]|mmetsp:Transcript_34055/g.75054  ORF Transcript_34055/g.75054 Transcript_34055/m.75054 type:complete len:264 (+) Transcript_34055:104-895(+)|eukprot:CAMPEP_0173209356 /NCGR_PEP_ID=MMETSP1141-20130122/23050_1 /TAXON_ID=483371 /ORGANISM="non described non described, Strain CCMP2298" /LENGTH=263 /DNA_ID=CAMNT_0014135957 /DNA_START=60 /DNA_END=851 /DNA_ORIENTATION=-